MKLSRNNKPRRPSRTEVTNLKQEIKLLSDQLDSLKQSVTPLIKEYEAVQEGQDRILISCDASYVEGQRASIGVIIRGDAIKVPTTDYIVLNKPSVSTSSNEAELDAIYSALDTLCSTLLHTTRDSRVKLIEIRSDSQLCIGWLNGKKKSKIPKLINKISIIREIIKTLSLLSNKEVKLVWRARNSTHDLKLANNIAQRSNNVKVH